MRASGWQRPDRQISLSDRRCPLDGDQRARFGHGRLQCAECGGYQTSSDRRPRSSTNEGSDRGQLSTIGEQAKAALGADALDVVADRSATSSGEQILACEEALHYVPRCFQTANLGQPGQGPVRQGRLRLCAQRRRLYLPRRRALRFTASPAIQQGLEPAPLTGPDACQSCAIKDRCHPRVRSWRITRWEHEHVLIGRRAASRREARRHARAPTNRRAPVWDD